MNSSFKYYRDKKRRDKVVLTDEEETYIDKLVKISEPYLVNNKQLPVERAIEEAYKAILENEIAQIEKQLKNAVLYATDRLKEKYKQELNNNIKDGESNNDY
jgi:HD-GYP domain-containing protein (c-di-GMP phosphodiesterase class II)